MRVKILAPLVLLGIWGVWLLCHPQACPVQQGVYQSVWPTKQCLDWRSWYHGGSKPLIVIYMGAQDWSSLEPWLQHWEKHAEVFAIALIDYGEEAVALEKQLPEKTELTKTWVLQSFNSAPYRLMPPGTLPASYVIIPGGEARGPWDYYDEIPV